MKRSEQIKKLLQAQEILREVQESGLWEPLHDAKHKIIRLIEDLERFENKPRSIDEKYKKAIVALKYYASSDSYGFLYSNPNVYAEIDKEDLGVGDFIINESMKIDDENVGGLLARKTLNELDEL